MLSRITAFSLVLFLLISARSQTVKLAVLKYNGGGDWYANLETSLPNLISFCNDELNTNINPEQEIVEVGSSQLFDFPFIHMTGHGNVVFSNSEINNLRQYLESGGFLHIDDNYGMDKFIRLEMLRVFPDLNWVRLPNSHPIFHQAFSFPYGLPKIHKHDDKDAEALALFFKGRMICLYTYESDLGDGWESAAVHNDSEQKRLEALQMGANIIQYVFSSNGYTP